MRINENLMEILEPIACAMVLYPFKEYLDFIHIQIHSYVYRIGFDNQSILAHSLDRHRCVYRFEMFYAYCIDNHYGTMN